MGSFLDLTGKRFGKWTVISRAKSKPNQRIRWNCECDCGTKRDVSAVNLCHGGSLCCGCSRHENDKRVLDRTGHKFGKLTVTKYAGMNSRRIPLWQCKCDCGNETVVMSTSLVSGNTKSCGCRGGGGGGGIGSGNPIGNPKHGLYRLPEYTVWTGLRARCRNPKAVGYKYYGGRGIRVCERWDSFENFIADMGPRPSDKHSIDRINNDGNYEPTNCRWATASQQNSNKRPSKRSKKK